MRVVVALALRTHIPVAAWLAEDDRTLHTAIEMLRDEDETARRRGR